MDTKAITKARSRLRIAEKALAELADCQNYESFTDIWYTFLVAAKGVYICLEQGAKSSPQSRQWYGSKKQERKNDPLLQYLFQARNDDEHGIEPVTNFVPGRIGIGVSKPDSSRDMIFGGIKFRDGVLTIEDAVAHDGKPIYVEHEPPHARLSPVASRGNVVYQPPKSHLGKPLESDLPVTVGQAAFAYLSSLVDDAERLT
jgi:hypothetical protein